MKGSNVLKRCINGAYSLLASLHDMCCETLCCTALLHNFVANPVPKYSLDSFKLIAHFHGLFNLRVKIWNFQSLVFSQEDAGGQCEGMQNISVVGI